MKLINRAISIALALVMVVSVLAISTVTSFADNKKYDDNIIVSYDQYINDYSYGTGVTATWPRQMTFNKDGWMRLMSYTKDEKPDADGNYKDGYFEYQWQYHGIVTPDYDEQFHNAMQASLDNGMAFHLYTYVKSASLAIATASGDAKYDDSIYVQMQCAFVIRWDSNFDGVLDSKDETTTISNTPNSVVNSNYGFRYVDTAFSTSIIAEIIDSNAIYRLEDIMIFAQQYQNKDEYGTKTNSKGQYFGLGNLDIAVSPCYTKTLPGFSEYNADNIAMFDAATMLDMNSFTENIDGLNTDEWSWDASQMKPEEVSKSRYGLGDLKRNENKLPLDKNGNTYTPVPAGSLEKNPAKVNVSNVKASNVTTNAVTLTWDADGEASYYHIRDLDHNISIENVKDKTYTITGLTAGTTYNFEVRAKNKVGVFGPYSSKFSVTTAKPAAPTTNPVVTPTVKPAAPTMSTSAKPTIKLKAAKKAITLTLKKAVARAQGYQIKYSLKKNMKKAKTVNLKANKKSLKIKRLKSKKKYFVRARAYATVNGKKVYSKWSKTMRVKVK